MSILDFLFKKNEPEAPKVVLRKDNHGRRPTELPSGNLPKPPAEDPGDGIWYHEMTPEQKKQYGFFKYGKK